MTQIPNLQITELDCRGQQCPAPILAVARRAISLEDGNFLLVHADDPAFPADLRAWADSANAKLVRFRERDGQFEALLRVGELVHDAEHELEAADEPDLAWGRPPTPDRPPSPTPPSPAAHLPRRPDTDAPRRPRANGLERTAPHEAPAPTWHQTLDVRGLQPPESITNLATAHGRALQNAVIRVLADDPDFPRSLYRWVEDSGASVIHIEHRGLEITALVRVNRPTRAVARPTDAEPPAEPSRARCTLLVLHNDHEALLAALLVANGAAAQGMETNVFFTFWGLNLLRGDRPNLAEARERVGPLQRLMKWMMPRGPRRQPLGKLHFGGLGKNLLRRIMRDQDLMLLPDLMRSAQELGVQFTACTMSMSVMGITRRDLHPHPNLSYGGVSSFVGDARGAELSLVF